MTEKQTHRPRVMPHERKEMADMYNRGMSIRNICTVTGRSYGSVHLALTKEKVEFRARNGKVRSAMDPNG